MSERVLIVGASRGLGLAIAEEYVKRGRQVVATVRSSGTPLHALRDRHPGALEIETVDTTSPEQLAALRRRLGGGTFDVLIVNAGTANDQNETIAEVSTDEFVRVMVTNALGPMRTVETLGGLVAADGTIGVMSSALGSVGNNTFGTWEVYRASKAALNTLMRSYAARAGDGRTLLLLHPGWVNTELGGASAPLTAEQSIPPLLDVIAAQHGATGLQFLNYRGEVLPW